MSTCYARGHEACHTTGNESPGGDPDDVLLPVWCHGGESSNHHTQRRQVCKAT